MSTAQPNTSKTGSKTIPPTLQPEGTVPLPAGLDQLNSGPAKPANVLGDLSAPAAAKEQAAPDGETERTGINSKLSATSKLGTIVELCKRRGFVYPTSEIYGGLSATYDYGPLGALMVKNLREIWMRELVQTSRNVVSMDGTILLHPRTWEASGHVEKFNDPMVRDTVTGTRYRADHLIKDALQMDPSSLTFGQMGQLLKERNVKSPAGNPLGDLETVSLMVQARVNGEDIYLRGETCQNIFTQFNNLMQTTRQSIPFGVVQIGKVFRNEVTARQFILRMREFEQMEFEFFVDPQDKTPWVQHWQDRFIDILNKHVGLPKDRLRYRELPEAEKSHYAKVAYDLEFRLDNGDWLEMSPLNHRGDWDLSRHSQYSGKDMRVLDEKTNRWFTPNVIETSFGVSRLLYLALDHGYREEQIPGKDETRTVLKLSPEVAPYKAAILPLSKKPELQEQANNIFKGLSRHFALDFDESQSIGKRYRRQDEIGTPFCITVDFETLQDQCVTVRDRDTMAQQRVAVSQLEKYLRERLTPQA